MRRQKAFGVQPETGREDHILAPTNWNVPAIQELFRNNDVNPQPAPGCPVED